MAGETFPQHLPPSEDDARAAAAQETPVGETLRDELDATTGDAATGRVSRRTQDGLLCVDAGYQAVARGYYRSRPTGAAENLYLYCTDGHGWLRLSGQSLTICPGDFVAIPAGIPYAYGADAKDPFSIYWFGIQSTLRDKDATLLCLRDSQPIIPLGHDPMVTSLCAELVGVLRDAHDPDDQLYLSGVLAHLLNVISRRRRSTKGSLPPAPQRVAATIDFMKQNLTRSLDIAQLCRMTQLSPSYYTALFKRQTGHSPLDYFAKLRMDSAARLLETTDRSVKTIAMTLGYKDALYFTRVFTGIHGVAPTEYRRRNQVAMSEVRGAAQAG